MNPNVISFHLQEAVQELTRTIQQVQENNNFEFEDFQVAMSHIYLHLNTAWNGRNQTDEEFSKCSQETFQRFRRFPKESDMLF
jgi:hypothetical protein